MSLLGSPFSVSPVSVYYLFLDSQSSTGFSLFQYLVATILYWCWFARNRATFYNSNLSPDSIVKLIKNDIQYRVRRDRPDSIRNFWSFKDVLCTIGVGDELTFFPAT